MSHPLIRKAVIPAAGLGSRLLPATKAVPKEMLPVAGKPAIQYAVEELIGSGIEEIIVVTRRAKTVLEQHFRRDCELESQLRARGQHDAADAMFRLSRMADIRYVSQSQPAGLADAIRCAGAAVDDNPFAVVLPDAIIDAATPCTRQLIDCYAATPGSYVAAREISTDELCRFGVLDVVPQNEQQPGGHSFRVKGLVEKPEPGHAPSRFAVFGRYIFQPNIFDYIAKTMPDPDGELQITDSLALCCREHPVFAFCFNGDHYDIGNPIGFMEATIKLGLQAPATAGAIRNLLQSLA